MSKNAQHVFPNQDGGWSVRRTGSNRATKSFERQSDAVNFAKSLARKQSSELYVHRKDGTIRERDSYGSDPAPPKYKS